MRSFNELKYSYPRTNALKLIYRKILHLQPGSGEIDFAEFCTLMARQMEKADPEFEYKKAFKIFDKRGDGFIDNAELKHVMTNIGEDMSDHDSK